MTWQRSDSRLSDAQIRAMRRDTLEVKEDGKVVGLAVRFVDREEDEPGFYYDIDWLRFIDVYFPNLSIIGSMAAVDMDTEREFVWFVAVRERKGF